MPHNGSPAIEMRRVKTGCLPCRRRRRKCKLQSISNDDLEPNVVTQLSDKLGPNPAFSGDENRPRCINCTKRGATCQYPDFRSLSPYPNPSHEAEGSLIRSQSTSSATTRHGNHGTEIHIHQSLPSPDAFAYDVTTLPDHGGERYDVIAELPLTSRPDQYPSTDHRNDELEAIHESVTHANFRSLHMSWNRPADAIADPASVTNDTGKESQNVLWPHSTSAVSGEVSVVSSDRPEIPSFLRGSTNNSVLRVMTQEDIQSLLHFRYCLAPWLDVNDSNAFFGVELLSTARDSSIVMSAVLKLAAIHKSVMSLSDSVNHARMNHQGSMHDLQDLLSRETISVQRKCRILLKIGECFALPPRKWRVIVSELNEYLGTSHSAVAEPLLLWCFRMDLAAAIVAQQPLLLDSHVWNSWRISNRSVSNGVTRHVSFFHILAECVLLTSEEQHTFSPSSTSTSIPRQIFSTRWLSLWDETQLWYQARPPEMCQVLSCRSVEAGIIDPSSTALFPIEIFSSPLALVQNVAYHVASILLLAKKPRLVQLQATSRQASSNAWHLHSIAGICERNNFAEQWDPVVIAGLLLIAPNITHNSQQEVLLQCLRRASHATGLDLSDEIMNLETCW